MSQGQITFALMIFLFLYGLGWIITGMYKETKTKEFLPSLLLGIFLCVVSIFVGTQVGIKNKTVYETIELHSIVPETTSYVSFENQENSQNKLLKYVDDFGTIKTIEVNKNMNIQWKEINSENSESLESSKEKNNDKNALVLKETETYSIFNKKVSVDIDNIEIHYNNSKKV